MTGGFVLVVGPSGAGKDTLIGLARDALAGDARFVFPRRLVTRPSSAYEDHDTLSDEAFAQSLKDGRFALAWRAHGLGYAIPRAALDAVHDGNIAICNVSRAVIADARMGLPGVSVLEITAPEDVLAARLAARGRAEDGDLMQRVARSRALDPVHADLVIVNDGAAEDAARELVAFLRAKAGGV